MLGFRWPSAAALLAALALLGGCGDDPPRDAKHPPRPMAFFPEKFPDIPLPGGYMLSPGEDQLAVALAGDTVRRFEVSLERRPSAPPQAQTELFARVKRDLSDHGWQVQSEDADAQHWRKGTEELVVEAGRTGSRTTIRYRLRPATTPAP